MTSFSLHYSKNYISVRTSVYFQFIFSLYNIVRKGDDMKVQVVYTTHCKEAKLLAEDMARYVKTYAKPISEFDFYEDIDLLVIGFEEYPCLKDKELENFICQLSRHHIKNLALFNLFCFKSKDMDKVIKLCQQQDLPLMRETYSCKKGMKQKCVLSDDVLSGGRIYIEDMVNICINYY